MADSKTALIAEKKSGWLSGLSNLGSFAAQTFAAYQTARAAPATVAPAPTPTPTPTSSRVPTLLVLGGAGVLAFLVLRRR
jgi:hypothetical protein